MDKKVQKSLVMLLAVMLVLSFGTIFPVHAQAETKTFVDPASSISYSYDPKTFAVDVKVANVTGLGGVEFELWWDPTLLSCVSMVEVLFTQNTPPGEEDNIWRIKHVIEPDHVWYSYGYMDMPRAIDEGYAPINITETYPPMERTIATITLQVEREPTKAEVYVECDLELLVSKLAGVEPWAPLIIPHTAVDGYYKRMWAPPVILPYLSVEPSSYTAREVGEEFDIDIMINNLDEGWELIGLEFKLGYNTSILEVLQVKNGSFFEPFGAPPNGGVFYIKIVEFDYVLVGILVLPDDYGTWWPPFPDGSGVVCTIRFNATYQGLFPEVASCALDLYDIKGGDTQPVQIPFGPEEDGYYEMTPKVIGRMIDVYTQYPFPFGGQGINATSDMFPPQKEIFLYALVTYNEWPEQNKVVTFEVRAPDGEIIALLSDMTDEVGIAMVSFQIPWPEGEQWLCGIFTVVASVDIASTVVEDWLWFHFDYLIRWESVTTDKREYKHCEDIVVTVRFKSKTMGYFPVIITVTFKDELKFIFGFIMVNGIEVGGAEWCEYVEYEVAFRVHVHKHVRAGVATAHINALNALPWDSGSAYCPECEPPEITILAEEV